MPRVIQSAHELNEIQREKQDDVIRFRVTPSLKKHIDEALDELGVKDLSSFARGALLSAIELAKMGRDPKWKEFLNTVNAGPARAILGHGLTLPEAMETEGRGKVRKGPTAEEFTKHLAARGKKHAVPA